MVVVRRKGGIGGIVPESETFWPCFAALELRSRSACFARSRGFWPLYSADMVGGVVGTFLACVGVENFELEL